MSNPCAQCLNLCRQGLHQKTRSLLTTSLTTHSLLLSSAFSSTHSSRPNSLLSLSPLTYPSQSRHFTETVLRPRPSKSFSTTADSADTLVSYSYFTASSDPAGEDPDAVLSNGHLSAKARIMRAMSKNLPALRMDHAAGATQRFKEGTLNIGDEASDPERDCFAVVDIETEQHKVMKGDLIMCEKLKGVDIGQRISLEQVYLLGTRAETIVGRPFVPRARVYATVEEQTKLRKIIVFKKKRRKGYKRNKGFRHDVTVLRIDGIEIGQRENGVEEVVAPSSALSSRLHSPFYEDLPGTEVRKGGYVEFDRPTPKQKNPL